MGIIDTIMDTCDRIVRYYERNENDIILKSGIVCSIGAVITACIATHKSEKIIEKAKEEIEEVQGDQKEILKIGAKAVAEVALNCAVPVALEVKSIHEIKKNDGIRKTEIASWKAIAGTAIIEINDIRRRIFENYGEEGENKIFYGLEKKNIPMTKDGKTKKEKVYVVEGTPVCHNIICFAPYTSRLYIDEERYDCPGTNEKRIDGVFKMMNRYLETSSNKFVSTNQLVYELGIQESKEWYNEGKVYGEGYIEYKTHKVYELWEGRYIPIYYIEINMMPYLHERLGSVLPSAPTYDL